MVLRLKMSLFVLAISFAFSYACNLNAAEYACNLNAAEVEAKLNEEGNRVTITIDGKLFAEYLTKSGTKPIVWPIIGPTGKRMTREYPMAEKGELEHCDHIHQRSLWFTHGDVNDTDFWAEESSEGRTKETGEINHREFVKIESGDEAVIVTRNDWCKKSDGQKILEDQTTLKFGGDDSVRWIDYEITLKAGDKPVRFGDTKEGSFGIRMAAPLKPDAKLGGVLVNSEGKVNAKAWGKEAEWVDYSGPIGGEIVGIAMMNHPSSFRYPTRWHARTYGLCSANPFGLSDFVGKGFDGSYTLPAGDSITFRYRVLFHKGNAKEAKIADAFSEYAKTKK